MFSKLSIRKKIILIVLTVSTISIVFVSIFHFIYSTERVRSLMIEQVKNESLLIGRYCVLPLEFGYKAKAKNVLDELILLPNVINATVYDLEGNLFATFKDENVVGHLVLKKGHDVQYRGDYITVSSPIRYNSEKYGTIVITVDSQRSIFIYRYILLSLLIIVLITAVSFVLVNIFQRQVSDPIVKMGQLFKTISKTNDYSHRLHIERDDELGFLVNQFNMMLEIILKRENERDIAFEAMKRSEAKFKAIFNQTFQMMGIVNPKGVLIDANRIALDLTGSKRNEVLNKPFVDGPWWVVDEHKKLLTDAIERGLKGEFSRFDVYHLNTHGEKVYIDFSLTPFLSETGEVVYLIPEGRDVTPLKAVERQLQELNESLEERVVERTVELERANKELEAFSYSVSHDLRAPLRGIDGFAHAIMEDYVDVLDDTGIDYLNRVRNAAQKLGIIIDEMLRLSKVSLFEMEKSKINLGELAQSILSEIIKDNTSQTIFEIEPDLYTVCDKSMMKIALENLINNAIKYSSKTDKPRISIGKIVKDQRTVFFIKDNGVGFETRYAKKLFTAFQRLHSTEEFAGTGVGLSIVKRVIDRHKGEIWAESNIGEGAVFYFTLNLKLEE